MSLLPISILAVEPTPVTVVVFKMDDVCARHGDVPERWQRLYDFAIEEQVPVSMGIICDSLEGDQPAYFQTLTAWSSSDLIELWNHGYDHKRWMDGDAKVSEFSNSGLEHQLKHIGDSQRLGREKLG
ncbi:hypothetical protein [Cerasicoccus frondis]|uniref:hypothetical protein n=1 Tax=Cerasicoccus frondis TaxID=490090 RepID=UPI0028528B1D|nr:hypothetical protein [Cerasicoccus frondis]